MEYNEKYIYKCDKDKPRLDLVPPILIEAVGTIMTFGLEKYSEDSWKRVEIKRYRAALMRHICAYLREPASVDEESGYLHLWHAACNLAFLCELEKQEGAENHENKDG